MADVADAAETDLRDDAVRSLSTHQRALYQIIREAPDGEVSATELHNRYEQRVQHPKTPRTRRRYLDSLARYGLITEVGTTRDRWCRVPK